MLSFRVVRSIVNYSFLFLLVTVVLSILDHFFFDEKFRSVISFFGRICLGCFFVGVIIYLFNLIGNKME